jgi:carboxyl-terminal processing protease
MKISKTKKYLLIVLTTFTLLTSIGFQSKFFEVAKQIDIYTTMFKELNMYYIDEVNPSELTNTAISNMLKNLDPYTRYFDEQGVEDARIMGTGEYGGIGAIAHYKNKTLTIREIYKNSPAEMAGLRVGDKILKIDDIVVEDFDDDGILALLNGLPKTMVKLQLERQNSSRVVEIVREKVEISAVPYYTLLGEDVGYISFVKFNNKASKEVKSAFLDLKDQGMEKLIIDVRNNPGGLLNEAVSIANYFIPKDKIIVRTKAKIEQWSQTFKTKSEPLDLEIPIVILVNNRSASASEILAGSLQDYDRAVIVGERSFGKGLVQRYRELSYGTQMKMTISKYYTPSGRCIQELDYTNRDDKGNIPKFSDDDRKEFKTEIGRTVFGGGGILPDIEIKKIKTTETTATLLNSEAFFNFVTKYSNENKTIAEPSKFKLNHKDYENLTNFLSQNHHDFQTNTEADFEKAKKKASTENLDATILKSYVALINEIKLEKFKELDKNENEILEKLTEEIVKRYYYSEGVYQQKAVFDSEISKAVTLLNNNSEYSKILK